MAPRNDGDKRRRVLLFPVPYQGHLNPMLHLAAALHARGLAITILHTETRALDPRSLPADYALVAIPDGISPELAASDDMVPFVFALNRNCAAPFREHLAAAVRDGDVACVVADVEWFTPLAVARELGVPALALMTTSAARFRVYLAYPRLCDQGYLPVHETNKNNPVDQHPPLLVRDLQRTMTTTKHLAYADMLAHVVTGVGQSSGLIINTVDAMEGADVEKIRRDISLPVFPVGPLHMLSQSVKSSLQPQEQSCLGWLDRQRPNSVLFVSFGTLVTIDSHEFLEIARGLADSKCPFLWVVRPRLVHGCDSGELLTGDLREELRDRGRIVDWAPQEQVLSHPALAAFVTHCGWNSTLESVSHGVPVICRPCGGDQFGTARYLCDVWKVGVMLEVEGDRLMRGDVRAAIERVVDGNVCGVLRQRMRDLTIAVTTCTTKGGSSNVAIKELVEFINAQ